MVCVGHVWGLCMYTTHTLPTQVGLLVHVGVVCMYMCVKNKRGYVYVYVCIYMVNCKHV